MPTTGETAMPDLETDGIPVDISDVSVPELQVDELPLDPPDYDDCEEGI